MAKEVQIFSKSQADCIKGLFAICVLIHHIYLKTAVLGASVLFDFILGNLGYLSVSFFLFASGFGLMYSLKYRHGYFTKLSRNILYVYIVQVLLIVLYTLEKFILRIDIDLSTFFLSFLFSDTVIDNGWYLQCITLFYIFFWIATKLTPNRIGIATICMVALYMILCYTVFNLYIWWYISSLAFPLGILVAENKNIVDEKITNKHYLYLFIFVFILIEVLLYKVNCTIYCSHKFAISFPLYIIQCCCISLLVYTLCGRFKFNNVLFKWFGSLFLEIYVLQGLVFNVLRNGRWYLANNFMYILLSIIGTIIVAYTFHPVFLKLRTSVKH